MNQQNSTDIKDFHGQDKTENKEKREKNLNENQNENLQVNKTDEAEKVEVLLMTPPCIELYEGLREVAPISPPLGILYIASVLEKNKVNVKVLDSYAENLNWDAIESKIKEHEPFILGSTCVTSTFNEVVKIMEIAKRINPKIITVVGGPHVTAIPKKSLEKDKNIDIIAIGEGDYTLLELYRGLKDNKSLKEINGIAYREGEKIIVNQ